MPKFKYKARDAEGRSFSGLATASDAAELHQQLRAEDKYLLSSAELRVRESTRPLKAKALSEFARQLGTLLGAGVSLVRALAILTQEELLSPRERMVYEELQRQVRQGVSLADAMEAQGRAFPPLLTNMFRSAEMDGSLDRTAMRMAAHYDKEFRLNAKLKSATAYPKVLCCLIVLVVAVIMGYVLPQFESLFAQMEALPVSTQIVMGISHFVAAKWWLLLILAACLAVLLKIVFGLSGVRLWWDKLQVHLPLIGKLRKTVYTARFARTISSMYASGVPIVSALQVARKTVGNRYIDQQFDAAIQALKNGRSLSDGLEMIDGFVKKLASTVRVGEETGKLDSMLDSIADTLDYESEMAITRMVTYLEPLMIIIMAVIVAFIIISVITPIYGSYDAISNHSYNYGY